MKLTMTIKCPADAIVGAGTWSAEGVTRLRRRAIELAPIELADAKRAFGILNPAGAVV